MSTATPSVEVYSVGLVAVSACAPVDTPREEIERAVNQQHPTGISSRWTISDDETFATGQSMPSPCDQHPDERQHWLLNC